MALAKYFENYKKLVEAHQHIREAHKRFYINWVELFLDYLKKIVLPKKNYLIVKNSLISQTILIETINIRTGR